MFKLPGGPGTRSAKPPFSDKPPPVLPPLKKIFGSKPLKPSFKLVLLCLGNPGGMGSVPEKQNTLRHTKKAKNVFSSPKTAC